MVYLFLTKCLLKLIRLLPCIIDWFVFFFSVWLFLNGKSLIKILEIHHIWWLTDLSIQLLSTRLFIHINTIIYDWLICWVVVDYFLPVLIITAAYSTICIRYMLLFYHVFAHFISSYIWSLYIKIWLILKFLIIFVYWSIFQGYFYCTYLMFKS